MTEEEIQANRIKAVTVLRETTEIQGRGQLYNPHAACYCAAGVIARELGHDPKANRDSGGDDAGESYDFLERALGLGDGGADTIWRLNDRERLPFKDIGDKLAERWGIQ